MTTLSPHLLGFDKLTKYILQVKNISNNSKLTFLLFWDFFFFLSHVFGPKIGISHRILTVQVDVEYSDMRLIIFYM